MCIRDRNQIQHINKNADVLFVPHLSSIERGIYSTHYLTIKDLDLDHLYDVYDDYYQDSQFIKIINQTYPKLGEVNTTNNCLISLFSSSDRNDDFNLVIMSAIDNLMKGASGQAVQNMNIMFGLKESTGLVKI